MTGDSPNMPAALSPVLAGTTLPKERYFWFLHNNLTFERGQRFNDKSFFCTFAV